MYKLGFGYFSFNKFNFHDFSWVYFRLKVTFIGILKLIFLKSWKASYEYLV